MYKHDDKHVEHLTLIQFGYFSEELGAKISIEYRDNLLSGEKIEIKYCMLREWQRFEVLM